jgi:hypothetical protein
VRVGKKSQSNALFYLKRQSEINRLLEFLIENRPESPSKKSSIG